MRDLRGIDATQLVTEAWEAGRQINLDGIGYGRIHWGNYREITSTPCPYYYFLAGLVRCAGVSRVLEIGTHSGGSARAMERGFVTGTEGQIVTVDVTRASNRYLKSHSSIVKIRGDANKPRTIDAILLALNGQPIDLLFIDGDHKFYPALFNYAVFTTLLRPKLVCLDDITLNPEMCRLWDVLRAAVPEGRAVNAAAIVPEIRPGTPGFGCTILHG